MLLIVISWLIIRWSTSQRCRVLFLMLSIHVCVCLRWYHLVGMSLSLPSTVSMALTQPTVDRSACQSSTSLVRHISTLLNVMICWFLRSELSLADGVSTLQLQSSGPHFWHGCTLPPLVVENSDRGASASSYKPHMILLRTLVLRLYLLTYYTDLLAIRHFACYTVCPHLGPSPTALLAYSHHKNRHLAIHKSTVSTVIMQFLQLYKCIIYVKFCRRTV